MPKEALVLKQIEGFSVKLSEAYVQHGSEPRSPKFSGGSGLKWVLTSSDNKVLDVMMIESSICRLDIQFVSIPFIIYYI